MNSSYQLWATPIPDVPIEHRIPKEVAGVLQADFANRAMLAIKEGQKQFGIGDEYNNVLFLVLIFFGLMVMSEDGKDRKKVF